MTKNVDETENQRKMDKQKNGIALFLKSKGAV